MIGAITRLFRSPPPAPRGPAYAAAMTESGDLVRRMQDAMQSPDATRALMASIWMQRHNIPILTTVYEAVQEMQSPIRGDTAAKAPPLRGPPR